MDNLERARCLLSFMDKFVCSFIEDSKDMATSIPRRKDQETTRRGGDEETRRPGDQEAMQAALQL